MNNLLAANKIQELNDLFRKTGQGGQCVITPGVQHLDLEAVLEIRHSVAHYNTFTQDNDPHGEHDFGAMDYCGHKLFWKIDYYDTSLTAGSSGPSDPSVTTRVLTIMLASEY